MATEIKIKKGEDKTITACLKQNGLPANLTGYTVTAQLSSRNPAAPVANGALIACDSGASGADFSAGIVKVTWTDTETAALTAGKMQLEVHAVLSGLKLKWISEDIINVVGTVIP